MGPTWSFLLMYGSHDMRHTGFPQVDGGQRDPRELGRHKGGRKFSRASARDFSTKRLPIDLKFGVLILLT